jgi:hypothetical protein
MIDLVEQSPETEGQEQPTPTKEGGLFDWIDALLIVCAFVGWLSIGIGVMSLDMLPDGIVQSVMNIGSLFAVSAAYRLRRAVFGKPRLSAPRMGMHWSLISMIGFVSILGGALTLFAAFGYFTASLESPPDFLEKAQALQDAAPDIYFPPPFKVGTTQEEMERIVAEDKRKDQKEKEERLEEMVAERTLSWEESRRQSIASGFEIAKNGLIACLLGIMCMAARYPKRRHELESNM